MRSLRGRLGVALGVTAVLSVLITGIVAVGLLRRYAERNARADLAMIALVVAIAVSVVLAQRLVKPVHDVSQAATRVAQGDLSQRVPVSEDDELGALGIAFNDMATALAESQRREREFLASVSHELRTPITAIRGYAEAIEDGAAKGAAGHAEAVGVIRSE